ncbi:tpr repeat-containing protein, partial [Chrysochromulina tobinii]
MEDSLAERALLNAITTAHVPTDRPCPTRHLAIAPPYEWSRTYMAAKDMEEYLPGVPLDATLVEATEDGFDVLASDGVTSLVHVVVDRRRQQPLRPGDPVVATVAGVGLEGDLLREGRPGEWVVRARTGGDQQPVEEMNVPASDVTFSWRVGRDMWMKAVRLAPLRLAARKADWLGIGSLEPVSEDAKAARRALSAGDPAALFGLQDAPELNGQGVTLLEKLGSSDGRWRVRLERLGDGDAPKECKVSAAAIGALPNWPFLGVSVACLRAFARAHEALLVDATTEDVCERVCKPLTETAGDSLAACLVRLGAADPVTGVPLAAAPTIFVSHARKYLDIFSQYQHWIGDVGTAQRPCNWDVVFQLTTAAIGHTCLVFAPWRDAVPLRRAWMLWVRLPPAESDDFQAALVGEFDVIAASVARIDSRSAECFTREDQAMVHAAIDRTLKGGHTELDARLSEALREWLAAEGRAALARMPRDERATSLMQNRLGSLLKDQGKLDEAEPLFREALEVQRATLGDWHPDTLASINNLGNLLKVQGKHDEAEPLLRQALEVQRATLGDRHPDTLGSIHNLGLLLKDQGKLDEAEPLVREALEAMRATLGDRHPHTLATINNLGNLLQDQGKLDKAEPLLREALEARRALLGGRHPVTLSSINNLGTLLKVQGKRDEAEPLLREALEAMRATLGNRHPHTLASIGNLGTLLQAQGKLDEAEPLKRKAFEVRRATLGDRHPDTLGSIHNLGTLLLAQGKLDEAEPLVREALEVQRATLGDRHPDTLGSINNLGTLLQDQGKLDEAEPL